MAIITSNKVWIRVSWPSNDAIIISYIFIWMQNEISLFIYYTPFFLHNFRHFSPTSESEKENGKKWHKTKMNWYITFQQLHKNATKKANPYFFAHSIFNFKIKRKIYVADMFMNTCYTFFWMDVVCRRERRKMKVNSHNKTKITENA